VNTLQTALQLQAAGISVVPVATDGSKRPAGNWKEYQTVRANTITIDSWFQNPESGIGVVTGKVSGGLEMAEIEGRGAERIPELATVAAAAGLGQLWTILCTGWLERSPSGGLHWFYRVKYPEGTKPPGNTKIASRPSTATELAGNPRQKKQVIAETRGEGGYVVTAPSAGTVHPTGRPWVRVAGGPDTLPVLSPDEREAFHNILATLHEQDPEQPHQDQLDPLPRTTDIDGITPGDDYENKTDWKDILEPAGWTLVTTRGRTRYWRRPGKNIGFSATTGHAEDRDRLFVWTSSTEFEQETPYTKFGAYALLVHGGNHSDAASALRKAGHGAPLPLERPLTLAPFTPLQATAPPATSAEKQPENIPEKIPAAAITGQNENRPETEGTAALATVHQLPVQTSQSRTDYGNARLFINRHGHHLRYAPSRGTWLQWDGNRWAFQEDDGPAVQHMWETVLAIDPITKELATHQERSLSRRSLEAAVALARRDPEVRVTADQLDAHPHELNTPAGIIDLRTGELLPPDPAKLHTKITGVHYDPNAAAPKWEAFLNTTFDGDQQMCDYIQRLAGYSAVGLVTEHVLPFLIGEGGNGKGQFVEVMLAIFGDYGTTAPGNFLMAGRDRHETEIARLAGMRFVVCSEINLGAKFDEAKVKLLTGGDKLTARFMNQNHFSFIPAHTMWLMANHKPTIAAGGESFFRRIRTLPFTHTIPEDKKIAGLSGMLLEEEGPGILNWIIAGAIDALKNGMRAPAAVMAATHLYAEEEDGFARFVTDRCTLGPAAAFRIDTASMRREYSNWCREQGETELSPQQFGRDLKARYDVQQTRSNGRRYYAGITVFTHPPEAAEHWSNQ
jgi:putative DNA primase/helicase